MPPKPKPVNERFDRMVVKHEGDGCWEFTGSKVGPKGHRKFAIMSGVFRLAHRYAWEREHGDPGELCVLHKCDNPCCVRVTHLFLGTRADNNADMDAKGRRRPHIGVKNPHAVLDDEKVLAIRLKRKEGLSMQAIANIYGVSRTTIQNVLENKTWRHV